MKTVRICCHSCDGNGWVEENLYPSNATVRVLCPECNGRKCVYAEKFEGDGATETEKILADKKLMRLIRAARKKGVKSSPYVPLGEKRKGDKK